jgi:hypothetical protein
MPFTFAHPAIVLPFSKIKHPSLSMSAFVIGSLTPDFEYFIRMKLSGRYSHSMEGMFLLDLPVAFAIAVIFHQLVKQPFIDNLPGYCFRRLFLLRNFDFVSYVRKHYFGFLICLLGGIASHILWDGFTHANEFFVARLDILSTPIAVDGLPTLPMFRYVQHLSTLIGGIAIVSVFHRIPILRIANQPSFNFWFGALIAAGSVFGLRACLVFEDFGDIVVSIISSVLIGLIISSILYRFNNG